MTCIVGLVDARGDTWIGGDSAGTSSDGLQTIREDRKVFCLNAPDQPEHQAKSPTLLIGGTTSYRFLDLLQYKLKVPPYNRAMNTKRWLVTVFIDALRTCLKSSGYDKKEEGEEQGGEFLLAWQGKLYHILDDYQVAEPTIGYEAIGGTSGNIAKGVLFATQKMDMSPKERIILALEAATYHCRSVRPPFIIERLPAQRGRDLERQ